MFNKHCLQCLMNFFEYYIIIKIIPNHIINFIIYYKHCHVNKLRQTTLVQILTQKNENPHYEKNGCFVNSLAIQFLNLQ